MGFDLFGKNSFLTRMSRILAILTYLLPVNSYAQINPNDPVDVDSGRFEFTDPQTGEKTSVTFSSVRVGDLENASPEQLNQIGSDLRENSKTFSDGSVTVVRPEGGSLPPAQVTQGLEVQDIQIPQKAYEAVDRLEQHLDQVDEKKPNFFKRQARNLMNHVGETSVKDWVFVSVFVVSTRVTIASYFAAQEHSLPYVILWASTVAGTTIANNVFHKPLDNWATKGTKNPDRSLMNADRGKIWYRFWKWDLFIDYTLNLITRRNSISQIFFDSFPRLTNNFVSVQKALLFKGDRELRRTYTLVPLIGITIAQQMNNNTHQTALTSWTLGHNAVLDFLHLSGQTVWEVRPSTLITAGIYLGLVTANAAAPKAMTKVVSFLHRLTDPITNAISKGVINAFQLKIKPTDPCGKAMRGWKSSDAAKEDSIVDDLP